MRAWWKRLLKSESAASPVIGVILMVGTTVILGASVYTWTSHYANVPDQAVKVLALSSDGPVEQNVKTYTISAVMPGIRYGDLNFTLDGQHLDMVDGLGCPSSVAPGTYVVCEGGRALRDRDTVTAGDTVTLYADRDQTLRVVDAHAGFVVLTLTVD